ncbi:hypothetical protein ACWD4V_01190 [Streptomyces tsukubensis]
MNRHPHPRQTATANRARTAAAVARDRFGSPKTIQILSFIAAHLDAAATACISYPNGSRSGFLEMGLALEDVRELITADPDCRFTSGVIEYILAPLTGTPLPELPRLLPASDQFAAQEAELRDRLDRLHADTDAADTDADRWFRAVLDVHSKWATLHISVAVDNRRPYNRARVAKLHLACTTCGGSAFTSPFREEAVCTCGKRQSWADIQVCDCLGDECPALRNIAARP